MSTVARYNTMLYFDEYLKPMFCPAEYTNEIDDEFEVDSYPCPVPGVMTDHARRIRGGYLMLTAEEMKGIFEPTFLEITNLIQQQVSAAETKTGAPVTVSTFRLMICGRSIEIFLTYLTRECYWSVALVPHATSLNTCQPS